MPSVSVIVTTFERPQVLRRVLEALARQVDRDFETVVADDGSGPATEAVVRETAGLLSGGILHVHQPDRGFRAAAARNRAAWASRGELLVFLDGDSIPRPGFVGAHRAAARPGWAVRGRRTLLSPRLTDETLAGQVRPEVAGPARWIAWRARGDLSRLRPLLSFDWAVPYTRTGIHWRRVHTVNFAVRREDFARLNGFDERFVGWGFEDSDLVLRLAHAGIRTRGLPAAGSVLHLHHEPCDRGRAEEHRRRIDALLRRPTVRCELGWDRVDPEVSTRRYGDAAVVAPAPVLATGR